LNHRYWVNPSTYWIGGVLSATLTKQPVSCHSTETAIFSAPLGQTCATYTRSFLAQAPGYLLNPEASVDCMYCPYASGDEYLATLNIHADNKWRNFGVFLAFCVSNWALVYFFVWTVRIKGWSFGFGAVARGVRKTLQLIKGKRKNIGENEV
jgi:ATP-binding cassette, subfamily G (WHITE), member 2, SNQ2